ncbi:unnamed protein product [Orchesella dallaii]|uniref:Tudor domain-containing protein n=1 Tax=Orchesella dallaii TaxID=48710 RepID=A0ABP1QT58_9HEXA
MDIPHVSGAQIEPCVCECCEAWKCTCDFSRFLGTKPYISTIAEPSTPTEADSAVLKSEANLKLSGATSDSNLLNCEFTSPIRLLSDRNSHTSTILLSDYQLYKPSSSKIIDSSASTDIILEYANEELDKAPEKCLKNECNPSIPSEQEPTFNPLTANTSAEKLDVDSSINCSEESICDHKQETITSNKDRIANGGLQLPSSSFASKMLLASDLPRKEVGNIGDIVTAFVTHVETPGEFYVIPKRNFLCGSKSFAIGSGTLALRRQSDAEVDLYCSKIKDFRYQHYRKMIFNLSSYMNMKSKTHQQLNYLIGEVVAARTIMQGSEVWMRGIVMDIYYSGKECEHLYKVQLIDFGRTDIVPWNAVAGLPEHFANMQSLAYRCSVGGMVPRFESDWGARAINKFKVLIDASKNDVLVEITLLGSAKAGQWPDVFEHKPYPIDVNVMDENGKYIYNIAHELSFGAWSTAYATSVAYVPWFSRLNLWWGGGWKDHEKKL